MHKTVKKAVKLVISTMAAFMLFACQRQVTTTGISGNGVSSASVIQKEGEYSKNQLKETYDEKTATVINLEDSCSITEGGTYVITGKSANGQIVINAPGEDVRLVLSGVDLASSSKAPLYVEAAENVYITLKDGSINTFTDSAGNTEEAVIFSKADLTINGTGQLNIYARAKDGIVSKDDLVITNGILTIDALDNGITGKDSMSIKQGTVNITAGGDGIKSDNEEDVTKGNIIIDGGNYTIHAGGNGIQAKQCLYINEGEFEIQTNDFGESQAEETADTKGLKAGTDIGINGGSFQINSTDDAIHGNGNITVRNGIFEIQSADDGIHCGATLEIDGGTISILESTEGLEGTNIVMNNGYVDITASDDGINIAGGKDRSATGDSETDKFSEVTEGILAINGGEVYVNAQGDGLDSNGSIAMTAGYVEVSGPVNDGNGALDYNGTFDISGGTLLVAGSSGMAQTPSEDSEQKVVAAIFDNEVEGGTKVTIEDETGEVIYSIIPEKTYKFVLVSGQYIENGETYIITAGTQSVTVTGGDVSGISSGPGMPGGGRPAGAPPEGKIPPDAKEK